MNTPSKLSTALLITLVAASLISLLSFGVRAAFGLFTAPLPADIGISREVYSMAIAIQNLCWGITQPFAGHFTDRFGARRAMQAGAVLYGLGVVWLVFASTPLEIYLSAGVLVGVGMGGASYTTALAGLSRAMPESHRGWALGLGTAAASLGQFVVVPVVQAFVDIGGSWTAGAWSMAAAVAAIFLATWLIAVDVPPAQRQNQPRVATREMLATALRNPSYVLLVLGFFVCGFQLAFITTHFPAYLSDAGLSASVASWAIAMVGLFNVVGAYMAGVLSGRASKKNLLGVIYLARGASIALFVLMPISTGSVLLFGATMGLLWLSTIPPTTGLVATFFGTRFMATLFGIAFFSHQVGSFLGVYLGGTLYERTGSYDAVWWLSIALSVLAGGLNLLIRERESEAFRRFAVA